MIVPARYNNPMASDTAEEIIAWVGMYAPKFIIPALDRISGIIIIPLNKNRKLIITNAVLTNGKDLKLPDAAKAYNANKKNIAATKYPER